MHTADTVRYYSDRELSAVAMSQVASEPYIKKIHLELAQRYSDLAQIPGRLVDKNPVRPVGETFPADVVHRLMFKNISGFDEVGDSELTALQRDR